VAENLLGSCGTGASLYGLRGRDARRHLRVCNLPQCHLEPLDKDRTPLQPVDALRALSGDGRELRRVDSARPGQIPNLAALDAEQHTKARVDMGTEAADCPLQLVETLLEISQVKQVRNDLTQHQRRNSAGREKKDDNDVAEQLLGATAEVIRQEDDRSDR